MHLITLRRTTSSRNPLDERSAHRRTSIWENLTLTSHKLLFPRRNPNPQPQQTSGPQTYGLDSTAKSTIWHISSAYLSLSRHSGAEFRLSTLITRSVLWSSVWDGETFCQINKVLFSFRSDSWKGTVKAVAGINETDNRRTGSYQAKLSAVNRDTGWRGNNKRERLHSSVHTDLTFATFTAVLLKIQRSCDMAPCWLVVSKG